MKNISAYRLGYNDKGVNDNLNYLTVNCCGLFRSFPKDLIVSRDLGKLDFQVIYIDDGKGYFFINGKSQVVSKGNIVLYRPGELQQYYYLSSDCPQIFWIHFTGFGATNLLDNLGFTGQNVFPVDFNSKYTDLFENIVYELQLRRHSFEGISSSNLSELLCLMSRSCFESKKTIAKINKEKIYTIIEMIHKNYNDKYSIQDFSSQCNMSVCWFIHCFKQITGMPPLEYITKVKIDKAKELLNNSNYNYNISEISDILGYDNPLYFSRIFKKVTGICPRIFMKNKATGF